MWKNEIDCCFDCVNIINCRERCVNTDNENCRVNECEPGSCKNFVRKRKLAISAQLGKGGYYYVEYWDGTKEVLLSEDVKRNPILVGEE